MLFVRFDPSCLFKMCETVENTFAKHSVEAWGLLKGSQDYEGVYYIDACKSAIFGKDYKQDPVMSAWGADQYDLTPFAVKVKKLQEKNPKKSSRIVGIFHSHPYRPIAVRTAGSQFMVNTYEDSLFQTTPSDTDSYTFKRLALPVNALIHYVRLRDAAKDPQCISKFLTFYISGKKFVYDAACQISVWGHTLPGPGMIENGLSEGRILYCVKRKSRWKCLIPTAWGSYESLNMGGS